MKKGFTILELLIVIAVIAILVGIALPRFQGMRQEGYIAQAKGELRTLQTGVESIRIHTGAYPTDLANLTTATPNIIGNIMPADPFSSNSANYGYATSGDYYVIYSVGPNANGTASVANNGHISETNGASCIYTTNGSPRDTQP